MSIQRPPPFTPQQRIDQDFENYPDATLNSWMRKLQQNPGYMMMANAQPLYPNLGYGDQPPPQTPQRRPPPWGKDDPLPKPPAQPPQGIHSGINGMAQALAAQDPSLGALFSMPNQQLQQMAGNVIRGHEGKFLGTSGDTLSDIADRYDRILNMGQPSGWGSIKGEPPPNVLPITPDVMNYSKPRR